MWHLGAKMDFEKAVEGVMADPRGYASLARTFAEEFTDDPDILNMVQYHDESYALYKQFSRAGSYDSQRFDNVNRHG